MTVIIPIVFPFKVLINGDTGELGCKVLSVEYSKLSFKTLTFCILPIDSDSKSIVASEAIVEDDPDSTGSFLYPVPPDINSTSPMPS